MSALSNDETADDAKLMKQQHGQDDDENKEERQQQQSSSSSATKAEKEKVNDSIKEETPEVRNKEEVDNVISSTLVDSNKIKSEEEEELLAKNNTKMPPNEADGAVLKIPDNSTNDDGAALTSANNEDSSHKVKFTGGASSTNADLTDVEKGGKNGDVGGSGNDDFAYRPLTKQELIDNYANDKFWVALRWVLFIGFWVIWVAMLVVSVIIIVQAPKCPPPKPKEWWQKAPIYQVYPKSFVDSNGDGKGDLQGITTKLDYLVNLGVGSVCLSPVYKSPQKDNGYDIQDFQSIDTDYGTLQDFQNMIKEMQNRNLKLIMDFVPNHSSDKHEWFEKSIAKEGDFADFYVWRDGSPGSPPNNWKSVFGGPAWTYNQERGQWYLHQFKSTQPDFNLRNEKVVEKLKEAMKFWLNMGVDGFRFVSVANMLESEDFGDEPPAGSSSNTGTNDYMTLNHTKTFNLPEDLDLLAEFRAVLDEVTEQDRANSIEKPRIMMTEAYVPDLHKYYGVNGTISQMPLNFDLISRFPSSSDATADNFKNSIMDYINKVPENDWANFVTGNHDNSRVANRFGSKLVDAVTMITMLLPGTPITYYGEEIGMEDASGNSDPRDPYRSPMQWDGSKYAGFMAAGSSVEPWLPLGTNFKDINVDVQSQPDKINTHIKIYQELAKLRVTESILFGDLEMKVKNNVLIYTRVRKGNPGYVVIVNFGDADINDLDISEMETLSDEGTVLTRSYREGSISENDVTANRKRVSFAQVPIKAKEGLVLSYVPKF